MAIAGLLILGVAGWAAAKFMPELLASTRVSQVEQLSEPALGKVLDDRLVGRNVFVLAAVAGNPRASGETLDRIARRTDPDLHEATVSVFDTVQGTNTRARAVMTLVAQNPNVWAESLDRLADSPEPSVLSAVSASPRLPKETLERLAASTDSVALRGVALNPRAPPDVLDRLSRSTDRNTRLYVASNRNTPPAVLERLRSDPDERVWREALRAATAPSDAAPWAPR